MPTLGPCGSIMGPSNRIIQLPPTLILAPADSIMKHNDMAPGIQA